MASAKIDKARPSEQSVVRLDLIGLNLPAEVAGERELPRRVNYFIGKDPKRWRTEIPTYSRVRYRGIYRGIDLVYYGSGQALEWDFELSPGADPRVITLAVRGADNLRVDEAG